MGPGARQGAERLRLQEPQDNRPPRCDNVCIDRRSSGFCYPMKTNGYWGPPCGGPEGGMKSSYGGCFTNNPTETCAVCTEAQGYCCPAKDIPTCPFDAKGKVNTMYGGINGG